jgi:hypothetical protein
MNKKFEFKKPYLDQYLIEKNIIPVKILKNEIINEIIKKRIKKAKILQNCLEKILNLEKNLNQNLFKENSNLEKELQMFFSEYYVFINNINKEILTELKVKGQNKNFFKEIYKESQKQNRNNPNFLSKENYYVYTDIIPCQYDFNSQLKKNYTGTIPRVNQVSYSSGKISLLYLEGEFKVFYWMNFGKFMIGDKKKAIVNIDYRAIFLNIILNFNRMFFPENFTPDKINWDEIYSELPKELLTEKKLNKNFIKRKILSIIFGGSSISLYMKNFNPNDISPYKRQKLQEFISNHYLIQIITQVTKKLDEENFFLGGELPIFEEEKKFSRKPGLIKKSNRTFSILETIESLLTTFVNLEMLQQKNYILLSLEHDGIISLIIGETDFNLDKKIKKKNKFYYKINIRPTRKNF